MAAEVFYNAAAELATVTNTFEVAGVPTNPTAVTLLVTDPDKVQTTYNWPTPADITNSGAGAFTIDVSCASTTQGIWVGVWTGTTAASDVEVVTWTTFDPAGPSRNYCSVEEVKSRIGRTSSVDDFEIRVAVDSACRWIDQHCERRFDRVTETRTFVPTEMYLLKPGDLVSVTTLKTDTGADGTFETTWTASDYQLLPLNPTAAAERAPYTQVRAVGALTFPWALGYGQRHDLVQIVGVWGWPAVPALVKTAALTLAVDHLKLRETAFGAAGSAEFGLVPVRPNGVVTSMLAGYRRYPLLLA